MRRFVLPFVSLILVSAITGQGGDIRRGRIEKLDLDKLSITLKVADKDIDFRLIEETQVLGATGKSLKERMKDFKVGSEIFFRAGKKDGIELLTHVKLAEPGAKQPKKAPPKTDVSKLIPLPDLGEKEYQGHPGGFYPEGKNARPAEHEAAGLRLARDVQPRDAAGKPSAKGKIVLLSVGMSNTSQASSGFQRALAGFAQKNPAVVFVNGAQGGMTAARIQNLDTMDGVKYWGEIDQRLESAGVTRAQVQAIWIKQADAGPTQGFPKYAKTLESELARIVQLFPSRFPNAKLVYLSSRTYGGFETSGLNPEPYAYESGFSVKWLIERQIRGDKELNFDPKKGDVKAPWLSWGPYLWGNGSFQRDNGLINWAQADFTANDGTHLTPSGQDKAGRALLQFFVKDATTRTWFKQ